MDQVVLALAAVNFPARTMALKSCSWNNAQATS
jgi:hypothetical protein